MDCIEIRDLECYCHHGVLKEENILGQKFLVSTKLFVDTRRAGTTDNLEYSVNYADVAHDISNMMKEHTYQLIETVAEQLAWNLLQKYKIIKKIEIQLQKPWAPVMLPLDTISLTIHREWTKVYVGVGSNMGNREAYIKEAFRGIGEDIYCRDAYMSNVIETEPYGYTEQDSFLNAVIAFETLYSADELLEFLQRLEQKANRKREIHWGPRTLDLDILFFGNQIIQKEDLIIPHKEIPLRGFVLEPLNEIAPYFIHPVFGKTVNELYLNWRKSEND